MSHVIERTSPIGQDFVGRCRKCGKQDLLPRDALRDCPEDDPEAAEGSDLLLALEAPKGDGDNATAAEVAGG